MRNSCYNSSPLETFKKEYFVYLPEITQSFFFFFSLSLSLFFLASLMAQKGTTEDEMVGWHHWMYMSLGELWELMNREAWRAAIHWRVASHGVTKSRTRLSD